MTGESPNEATVAGLPPIATPTTVNIPEPMTAPIPNAVRDTGPSVFFNACSGLSDSEISLSIDLVRKICLASALAPAYRKIGAVRFNCRCGFRMLCKITASCESEALSQPQRFRLNRIDYRLLWPRVAFLTLALFSPRAPVRGPLGAAFFRAARLTFLRSCLSVMLLVFAMVLANLSISAIFETQRRSSWANFSTSFFTPCC